MKSQKVYIITSDGGPTKIGRSHQPHVRRAHLQSQFKDRKLTIGHVAELDGLKASAVERKVHELLHETRVHGEWFDVDVDRATQAIEDAIAVVREAGLVDEPRVHKNKVIIHLRLTLESSTREWLEKEAMSQRRTVSNFVGWLIEQHIKQLDAENNRP
jgi:hypothetical protein